MVFHFLTLMPSMILIKTNKLTRLKYINMYYYTMALYLSDDNIIHEIYITGMHESIRSTLEDDDLRLIIIRSNDVLNIITYKRNKVLYQFTFDHIIDACFANGLENVIIRI